MHLKPSLFLQPHYDDVALSCGGTAALASRRRKTAHIATVFASDIVQEMVGEFAAWKHARWQLGDTDTVVSARRAEDACAAHKLGCELRWLGLPDAIYRGDRYTRDEHLYGGLHPEERALADHLAEEVLGLPEWSPQMRLYVPLGVGGHVDHQLVFEAGARLAARGVDVWAYEDLPYGIHTPAALPRRLRQIAGRVRHRVLVPIRQTLACKLEAIACYRSQLPVIFRFTDDFRRAIEGHAAKAGGGLGPAERFWPVVR